MPEDRPIVACLGSTEENSFPLLLVFGREYNGEGTVSLRVGTYDFTESPRSTFWNRTYRFLERNCVSGSQLKARCVAGRSSPVIFANVFPKPIPNCFSGRAKRAIRESVSFEVLSGHLGSIFCLALMKRVKAVILSLGQDSQFSPAAECVRQLCAVARQPLVELPYFGSHVRVPVFDSVLTDAQRQPLCSVLASFPAPAVRINGRPTTRSSGSPRQRGAR